MKINKKIGKKRNMKRGFTLIEILIVVAIMAVISAIVVIPNIKALNKAKESVDKQNAKIIEMAFEEYYMDNGAFPKAIEIGKNLSEDTNPFLDIAEKNYLKKLPNIQKNGGKWVVSNYNQEDGTIEIGIKNDD